MSDHHKLSDEATTKSQNGPQAGQPFGWKEHEERLLRERLIGLAVGLGSDINHTKQAAEWEKYITTGEPTEWTQS